MKKNNKNSRNQDVANWLDTLKLSDLAGWVIANTDISIYEEMFGGCHNAEEVEELCKMCADEAESGNE